MAGGTGAAVMPWYSSPVPASRSRFGTPPIEKGQRVVDEGS